MPRIPLVINNQPISGQQFPIGSREAYGYGIGTSLLEAGDTFSKIRLDMTP